jgi:hypothetical protein
MEKNIPYIYRRKILATSKYYIGKHNGCNSKYYKGSGVDYLKDLKLYKETQTEILEYVGDISKLNEREEWWLQSVDAANNPLYYNKTNRSRGWSTVTKEQKEKLRVAHTGKKMSKESSLKKSKSMLGIPKHTSISKQAIGNKNRISKPIGFKDKLKKPKTEQHKQNISNSKKGKSRKDLQKCITQYDKQGNFIKEWPSINEVIQNLGKGNFWKACKDFNKTAKGFKWKLN